MSRMYCFWLCFCGFICNLLSANIDFALRSMAWEKDNEMTVSWIFLQVDDNIYVYGLNHFRHFDIIKAKIRRVKQLPTQNETE